MEFGNFSSVSLLVAADPTATSQHLINRRKDKSATPLLDTYASGRQGLHLQSRLVALRHSQDTHFGIEWMLLPDGISGMKSGICVSFMSFHSIALGGLAIARCGRHGNTP